MRQNSPSRRILFRQFACTGSWTGLLLWVLALIFNGSALALESSPNERALQILERHCIGCHGPDQQKGGLDLSSRAGLTKGGESGMVVVHGEPERSLLIQRVRHEQEPGMPHKEEPLSPENISSLAKWVEEGAPYSRTLASSTPQSPGFKITEVDKKHWAFQPVSKPSLPIVKDEQSRAFNQIDLFILQKLENVGLGMAPAAQKEQLIRRVTVDLTGLLPTVEELDSFLADKSPDAYERLIDRLLASPRYGERWGRHWLDLARYAETDGFELDAIREHTWRYRDYVIRSFNLDTPYDRLIREQIAGDELWPEQPDALIATAFNLLGPDMVDSADQVQRRHNTLNDMTDTASLTFLGLTMGCARCHDHKFEPISQKDYYQLQAFFTPVKFQRDRPIPNAWEQRAHQQELIAYEAHPKVKELRDFEAPYREKIYRKKLQALTPEAREAHATDPEMRTEEQSNLVLETLPKLNVSVQELEKTLSHEEKTVRKELLEEVKRVPKPRPLPRALAFAGSDRDAKTFVLQRGDYKQPSEEIHAGVPGILQSPSSDTIMAGKRSRSQLAHWIASPDNPLTSRVMVNRLWQYHFGRGLVATPSDFGTRGAKPSHPELLDWLAAELVEGGWRLKRMHKLMLMSATYRQAAIHTGENELYSGMNRIRMEGEVIRDSLLQVSGRLEEEMGGPGVYPPIPRELFAGAHGWSQSDPAAERRRSIYIFVRRNLRFPFLEVFDAPDNNLSCPTRERSVTAPQSLTLLNSDEVMKAADLTAARVVAQSPEVGDQIFLLYRTILGRAPVEHEISIAREFLDQWPLKELCRALFNLNEFVYLR